MPATIALEILTPDGPKLKEAVDELTARSVFGEFGVLPMHCPLMAALVTGILTYIQNGKSESVAIGLGFVEVANDRAIFLTDRFIKKDDVDPVRARLELKHVDEQLAQFQGDPSGPEYVALVEREYWAAAQLELHGDPPPPRVRNVFTLGPMEDYTARAEGQSAAHGEDTL